LRRTHNHKIDYREIQVKYGKLYPVGGKWEKELFDFTSWRFFKEHEFDKYADNKILFICYILAPDDGYNKDLFIFPIKEFIKIIGMAYKRGDRKAILLSRSKDNPKKWYLRIKKNKFEILSTENVFDVSNYYRNFDLLS
jgi:hypothetical protein